MKSTVLAYLLYVPAAVFLTVWVARTLRHNGRVFLIQAFHGNETMADSVNHLLVVGFYLINLGFVSTALRYGDKPHDLQEMIEFLSMKLGVVMLVLGAMHFFNMFNFDKMRRKALRSETVVTAPIALPLTPPALPATALRP